jgi:tetratricopeptide (TPR) repeat protein
MGKYDKSIQDFKEALIYDPSNTVAYSNIGIVYRKMERFEEAIEYFTKEIELNGKNS